MRKLLAPAPCFLIGMLVASEGGCGPSRPTQDSNDQARLEEIFGIPAGCELVSYVGYPPRMGFGQREGLSLSATYRIGEGLTANFVERSLSEGWRELPVPDSVISCIPFQGLDVPLDAAAGIYTCRTAGDNVLFADSTVPVEEAGRVNDIIIGIFDSETGLLHVAVRSGY